MPKLSESIPLGPFLERPEAPPSSLTPYIRHDHLESTPVLEGSWFLWLVSLKMMMTHQ